MGLYINPNDIEIYHSGYRQHKYITRLYKNGHWVYKYAPDVEKQTLKENIKVEDLPLRFLLGVDVELVEDHQLFVL